MTAETPTPRPSVNALLDRYRSVLTAAWAARHGSGEPPRRNDEMEFLPAALSLQETPVHPAPRRCSLIICGLFAIALAWSIAGSVDIVAVAHGRIVVGDRTKTIQPLESGVVQKVWVRDGDEVRAGQVLMELDATNPKADGASIDEQLASTLSEQLRTDALSRSLRGNQFAPTLLLSQPVAPGWGPNEARRQVAESQLQAEWQDIAAKLARFEAEAVRRQAEMTTVREAMAKLEATLPIARQREFDVRRLAEQGFMSGHAGQDRERDRIELERDLSTQRARLFEAEAALHETRQTARSYLAETRRALGERHARATLQHQQLTQENYKVAQRGQLTRLTSPVDGRVQQLAVHTAGSVVTPAQVLMVVVPRDAQLHAEVVVHNKDIGFVNAKQRAEVKLETFPFTRYGTIPAKVIGVTADAVQDERHGAIFPAMIELERRVIDIDGKTVRLSPGMNVTAEIRTGRRRVIDFLLSPVEQMLSESLGER